MKYLSSKEIRAMWLKYFSEHGHMIVPSASLIPQNDDTLLWINAGVTPLKRYFDGSEIPISRRLTNIQKCIRTNDIENVGVTRRHHTFFEMMGNFSIGDYFRDEAIGFAFELLTSEEWFGIPKEKIYVTVFPDDQDSINRWVEVGLAKDHLVPLEDNFWEIGPGPCGPDTEIFFDRGEAYDPDGDAYEKFLRGDDNERFIEIWNNVLSQFNSEPGKERKDYQELPSKNIDTGAGIERWACIFQNADSNFDTDLFMPIIEQVEKLSGVIYDGSMPFKVIADHIRTLTFALADGAVFENVGRGYILRRLLRRSVRFGKKLGLHGQFMYKLVDSVVENYRDVYPYLVSKNARIKTLIMREEELFNRTLASGEKKLMELMDESIDKTISGLDVFKLYDTYGFPYELTLEYLEEKGYTTSREEFDKYMNEQKDNSKNNQHHESSMQQQNELLLNFKDKSEFVYDEYQMDAKVIALIKDNEIVDEINDNGYVIFDKTCFYATSGGEVADTGTITSKSFNASVTDVTKGPNGQNIHEIKVNSGSIKMGGTYHLALDEERRVSIEHNHSSVHLLQYALRSLISKEISQAGSYVIDNYLRFDFNYLGKITDEELVSVEKKVNELIKKGISREIEFKKLSEINKEEVMALFSEKYGDIVRLVTFGESKELCGGCHTKNTKDIKLFAITSFTNKGSNTYRIEASTGNYIKDELLKIAKPLLDEINKLNIKGQTIMQEANSNSIDIKFENLVVKEEFTSYQDLINLKNNLSKLQETVKLIEKDYSKNKEEKLVKELNVLEEDIQEVNGTNYLLKIVNDIDVNSLKQVLDNLVNKYPKLFILIADKTSKNITFLSRSNTNISSGKVIKEISTRCGGNGGGSPTFAQGSGKEDKEIDNVFKELIDGKYQE